MSNNLYDVLEMCLSEIEQGADVDAVLFRHPEFANELRPILETSIKAMEMAAPEPSAHVVQINRSQLLQRAAEMREAQRKPASRFWSASLRRVAVTLTILLLMFVSGTGLVRASSNTIPGDELYPVKRTWEDIILLFTFDPQEREMLEFEHENERLEELNELFTEGRAVPVDFAGYVTRQSEGEWRVSGITILLSPQTSLPNQPVAVGDAVHIVGLTQSEKTVLAQRIELLPTGSKLPDVEDNEAGHEEENEEQKPPENDNSNSNSDSGSTNNDSNTDHETPPAPESDNSSSENGSSENENKEGSIKGVVNSKNDDGLWMVNGQAVDVSRAEIEGNPVIGSTVIVEGYWDSQGVLIARKVEALIEKNGNLNNNDHSNDNTDDNNNHNDNDDNDNDDD